MEGNELPTVSGLRCAKCGSKDATHEIIDEQNWTQDHDFMWFRRTHQALRCVACRGLSVREQTNFSEDPGPSEWKCFPAPLKREPSQLIEAHCPWALATLYLEVIDCFNNSNRRLCAVGVRSLIEGTCKAVGLSLDPLADLVSRIQALAKDGWIGKRQVDVLKQQKEIGDLTVHELARPRDEELEHLLDLVEVFLVQVFVTKEIAGLLADTKLGREAVESAEKRRDHRRKKKAAKKAAKKKTTKSTKKKA